MKVKVAIVVPYRVNDVTREMSLSEIKGWKAYPRISWKNYFYVTPDIEDMDDLDIFDGKQIYILLN